MNCLNWPPWSDKFISSHTIEQESCIQYVTVCIKSCIIIHHDYTSPKIRIDMICFLKLLHDWMKVQQKSIKPRILPWWSKRTLPRILHLQLIPKLDVNSEGGVFNHPVWKQKIMKMGIFQPQVWGWTILNSSIKGITSAIVGSCNQKSLIAQISENCVTSRKEDVKKCLKTRP